MKILLGMVVGIWLTTWVPDHLLWVPLIVYFALWLAWTEPWAAAHGDRVLDPQPECEHLHRARRRTTDPLYCLDCYENLEVSGQANRRKVG
jgi:hypothetical protein